MSVLIGTHGGIFASGLELRHILGGSHLNKVNPIAYGSGFDLECSPRPKLSEYINRFIGGIPIEDLRGYFHWEPVYSRFFHSNHGQTVLGAAMGLPNQYGILDMFYSDDLIVGKSITWRIMEFEYIIAGEQSLKMFKVTLNVNYMRNNSV